MSNSRGMKVPQVVVSGEDVESEEEAEPGWNSAAPAVVTFGEAPESDEEFGSTVSLNSSVNSIEGQLGAEAVAVLAPIILPQRRSPRLDPVAVKRHRERNKSLRLNISEKFLTPVIQQSVRKFEKLSQNLSNSQTQLQDALFHSRLATGNLLKLQKELEVFLEEDYMKDLKILPSDIVPAERSAEGDQQDNKSSSGTGARKNSMTSSTSLLTAALTGGAHLI